MQGKGDIFVFSVAITDMQEIHPGLDDSVDLSGLEENSRLEWAIKNHAVIAIWDEKSSDSTSVSRHLGNRTPHNREDSNLRLWMGEVTETQQLLTVLVIDIRLRASRKTPPRRMFFVIPSESLRLEITTPTFGELCKHNVPDSLLEYPSDKCSADSARLLHISFNLDHDASSKVIMPKAECSRPTVGQPLHLLQSLRSLAQARKFDVYLNFNTYAQQHLGVLMSKLNKSKLITPSIDLASMYAGRGGSIGNWSAQGLLGEGQATLAHKRRKIVHDDDVQTETVEQCPPPYSTLGGQILVPRSCTPEPLAFTIGSGSCVPDTPRILLNRPAKDLGLKNSLPTNAPSLACAQKSAIRTEDCDLNVTVQPLLLPSPKPSALNNLSCQQNLLSSKIYIDMCLWLTKAWTTCPNAHFLFSAHLLSMGAAAHDKDDVLYTCKRAESTTDLLYHLAQRIDSRTTTNPGMVFLREKGRQASAALREKAIKQETTRMVIWMNIIRPHADLPLMGECLARWVEKGVQLIQHSQDGSEGQDAYDMLLSEFERCKAFCVAETCLSFGKESMARLDGIVARLQEEAKR